MVRRAAQIWLILMALQLFALLTAGLFWLGGTFVQLSLWRFSPHAKLLAVSAAAVWLVAPKGVRSRPAPSTPGKPDDADAGRLLTPSAPRWQVALLALLMVGTVLATFAYLVGSLPSSDAAINPDRGANAFRAAFLLMPAVVLCCLVALPGGRGRGVLFCVLAAVLLGLNLAAVVADRLPPPGQPAPDPAILAAATWAEKNSPLNALFLLPPDASAFGVNARRGQVVSFKLVPQLAGELAQWDQRLRDVLDVPDLSVYAGGFAGYRDAQRHMRERYDALPSDHLFAVARRYGARYVFRSTEDPAAGAAVAWRGTGGAVLYDLATPPPTSRPAPR